MPEQLALSTDELARLLSTGEFDDLDPLTGNCESFAVATARTVEVDGFAAVYDPFDTSRAVHAAVHLDGTVFDAKGERGDPANLLDYLSFLKLRDFPETGFESGEELFDWLEAEHLHVTHEPDEQLLHWKISVVSESTRRLWETAKNLGITSE
jgi:hypothetical protein